MKDLADALDKTITTFYPDANSKSDSELMEAAQRWTGYCLSNMKGDLLHRGLAVAEAIANFDVGFFHPETLKD